jgi:hypothetical protein
MTCAWSAWKLPGALRYDSIQPPWTPGLHLRRRQRNGNLGISAWKFHRHVDIVQAVFVGKINRLLRMQKVVRLGLIPGPAVHGPQVVERFPILQQYFHIYLAAMFPGNLVK